MSEYICITQNTAGWLLQKKELGQAIYNYLSDASNRKALQSADAMQGPVRMSGSSNGNIIAIWNVEYLTGTGVELWGVIKIDGRYGLFSDVHQGLGFEIFERFLYIVDQRLQGLFIDGRYIYESLQNGTHRCLAGRGDEARQYSLCWDENDVKVNYSQIKALICIGPSRDNDGMANEVRALANNVEKMIIDVNQILSPKERRPILDTLNFPVSRENFLATKQSQEVLSQICVPLEAKTIPLEEMYKTYSWTYEEWIDSNSTLSISQRKILEADIILKYPLRILGPGGSGKTRLMQLLVMRLLEQKVKDDNSFKIIYIVHNSAMAQSVSERFDILGANRYMTGESPNLKIKTLAECGCEELGLTISSIIDRDAHESKMYQLDQIKHAFRKTLEGNAKIVSESKIFQSALTNENVFSTISGLVMTEISNVIKGHGLINDSKRYIQSEKSLSRLHGNLSPQERKIIFETFTNYHKVVFEEMEVLDSDDIATDMVNRLRTRLWEMKRKTLGHDFVFVDETQLFNENERRVFPLLTKNNKDYVPIVLALDEAQEPFNLVSAGFGTLGIQELENASLQSMHRSTRAIVELAFFIIQRTTDLFGPEFPDFTGISEIMIPDSHTQAEKPSIEKCSEDTKSIAKCAIKKVRDLRRKNTRQIAIICHSDLYYEEIRKELENTRAENCKIMVLEQRGIKICQDEPMIILARPAYVGGQEFDAVIVVGLEQNLIPPRVLDNEALTAAIEQQSLREIYLSFTRAKYKIVVLINKDAFPADVINDAIKADLIENRIEGTVRN